MGAAPPVEAVAAGHGVARGRSRPGGWREALRILARRSRQAAVRHGWLAGLFGGRPTLGPNGLAVTEATLAALDGLADIDTVMRAVETLSAPPSPARSGARSRTCGPSAPRACPGATGSASPALMWRECWPPAASRRWPRPCTTARTWTPRHPSRPAWTGCWTPWPPDSPGHRRDAQLLPNVSAVGVARIGRW